MVEWSFNAFLVTQFVDNPIDNNPLSVTAYKGYVGQHYGVWIIIFAGREGNFMLPTTYKTKEDAKKAVEGAFS